MKISLNGRQYLIEWCLLIIGAAIGLALAWVLVGFEWSFPGELESARATGVVSLTTLAGYAKSRDMVAYFFTLVLPVVGALLFWFFGRRSSDLGKNILGGGFDKPTLRMWLLVILVPLMTGFFAWNLSSIFIPRWNPYVGAWIFLGEQGATLAWAQSIASGGIYGRDFFSLYGPMFIYPFSWLMSWLGNSAYMEPIFKWGLDIIAFGLLGFILIRTLRSRLLALVFIIIVFLMFPSQRITIANATILRSVLGIFPIVCIALWIDTRRTMWFVAGGLVVGQSILFSQEAGLCSTLAIAVILITYGLSKDKAISSTLLTMSKYIIIVLLSLAPMVGFLVVNGGGPGLLDSIVGFPQMVMLGFGGIPFPSLRDWLGGYFREMWLHFAVISVYCASIIALCVAWFRGVRSPRFFWALGLVTYGVLLFRVALGRSGDPQTIKVMIPAIILSALWVDELWISWRQNPTMNIRRFISLVSLTVILINFTSGICLNQTVRNFIASAWQDAFNMNGKFSAIPNRGIAIPEIPRLGMSVDELTEISLREIKHFIDGHTKQREYVYFFPNEAIYYFLFDRTNPTRYPIAYFATTYERQREVIRDLEKNKPHYVVYSKNTWRVDNIYEQMQIPYIVTYLNQRYKTIRRLQTVNILERVPEK